MKNRNDQNINVRRQHLEKGNSRRVKIGKIPQCFITGIYVVLTMIVLSTVFVCNGCTDNGRNTELVGTWRYDQYTEYEFLDEHSGCMCLDSNTHYEFTYRVKENTLYINFTLDYVTDCQYTYSIEDEKLTLIGGEGTAELGKIYELTKIK